MAVLTRVLTLASLAAAGKFSFPLTQSSLLTSRSPLALAQSSTAYTDSGIAFQGWTDTTTNITIGFALPPTTATGATATEFIGEIRAPIANKWAGIALGGQMANNLLLVAWPNAGAVVASPRFATGYIQPTVYAGPTLTTLSSAVTATDWTWVFRCQNCTAWAGGALDTSSSAVMAYVYGLTAVDTPASASSNFLEHDGFDFWGELLVDAHTDDYSSYL